MLKKLNIKRRQWLRTLFGMFSFTAMMFAFQACYGVPSNNIGSISGYIVNEDDDPIQGISVSCNESCYGYVVSDSSGHYSFKICSKPPFNLHFESYSEGDVQYQDIDTTINPFSNIQEDAQNINYDVHFDITMSKL